VSFFIFGEGRTCFGGREDSGMQEEQLYLNAEDSLIFADRHMKFDQS